ncbi:MAG: ROK family protein [Candidatus Dormibacteria bacterium]
MIAVLDIGGTKVAAARAHEGRLGPVLRQATSADEPEAQLVTLVDRVLDGARPTGIGVSAPGPFDREAGALLNPPGLSATWHNLSLARILSARFACPAAVENDANCAALAEARRGAGAGARTVVYFTVSTGIGSGIVRNGAILATRSDTEGGHQVLWPEWKGGPPCHCGGHGCLETLASGRAIERRFGVRAEKLDDAAAWDDVGRWLGLGVINVIALHDPDVVLFGGGVCRAWDRFAASLLATVRSHLFLQPLPRIERGALGEERNLLGAAEVLVDRLASMQ